MRRIALITLILILAAAPLYLTACKNSDGSPVAESAAETARLIPVSVAEVQPSPIRDVLLLPGETEAWQDVRISADTVGRVEWIGPHEGDKVEKGQLLAKIDVSSLKAGLDQAETSCKLSQDLLDRRKQLYERKSIAREDLERSESECRLSEAGLRRAKVEYERGFVRSPISGTVDKLHIDEGEFIDRGKPLADVVNVDKIKVNVNVPEMDVRYLKTGQQSMVTIDAYPGKELIGAIDFVAFKADPATRTFQVRVLVENKDHLIRPGMIARTAFLRRIIPDALTAPLSALVDKGGERLVFIEKDGMVQSRTVNLGVIDGQRIQITKGLEPGDHLIVVGQKQVEEGMKVVVQ